MSKGREKKKERERERMKKNPQKQRPLFLSFMKIGLSKGRLLPVWPWFSLGPAECITLSFA